MRSPNESRVNRVSFRLSAIAALAAMLAGCGMFGSSSDGPALAQATVPNGPAADYPMVIGDPYFIDGVEYVPVDTLNYDEVGAVMLDAEGAEAITGAHRTLPLPSYVEVTSLETGRTILARLTNRGPMSGQGVVGLSPGALAQLEAGAGTPVRVRRVNPPEGERALLRAGEHAPLRMDTPMSLVNVLRRRLPETGSVSLARAKDAPQPDEAAEVPQVADQAPVEAAGNDDPPALAPIATEAPTQLAQVDVQPSAAAPEPEPEALPEAAPAVTAAVGIYVVQAGAFSTQDRADRVANVIGGSVSRSGKLYRVRTGPFETRTQAEASLAKVQAAGYREARIFKSG